MVAVDAALNAFAVPYAPVLYVPEQRYSFSICLLIASYRMCMLMNMYDRMQRSGGAGLTTRVQ